MARRQRGVLQRIANNDTLTGIYIGRNFRICSRICWELALRWYVRTDCTCSTYWIWEGAFPDWPLALQWWTNRHLCSVRRNTRITWKYLCVRGNAANTICCGRMYHAARCSSSLRPQRTIIAMAPCTINSYTTQYSTEETLRAQNSAQFLRHWNCQWFSSLRLSLHRTCRCCNTGGSNARSVVPCRIRRGNATDHAGCRISRKTSSSRGAKTHHEILPHRHNGSSSSVHPPRPKPWHPLPQSTHERRPYGIGVCFLSRGLGFRGRPQENTKGTVTSPSLYPLVFPTNTQFSFFSRSSRNAFTSNTSVRNRSSLIFGLSLGGSISSSCSPVSTSGV